MTQHLWSRPDTTNDDNVTGAAVTAGDVRVSVRPLENLAMRPDGPEMTPICGLGVRIAQSRVLGRPPMHLVTCRHCSNLIRSRERQCPFCDGRVARDVRLGAAAAAVLAGLVFSGCAADSENPMGAETETDGVADSDGPNDSHGHSSYTTASPLPSGEATYGVPSTSDDDWWGTGSTSDAWGDSSTTEDAESTGSSSGVPGTDTDTDSPAADTDGGTDPDTDADTDAATDTDGGTDTHADPTAG